MKNTASNRQRVAALVLSLLFAIVALRSAWLADDAYITLRTVRNLHDGFGPVWNIGERVQAFTHPLWMLVLALFTLPTQEYYFTTLAISLIVAVGAFYLLVRYLAVDWAVAVVGGTILILAKSSVDYATSGLENALTHLILAIFLLCYLKRDQGLRQIGWLALVAAFGGMNRLDTLLLFLPPLAYALYALRGQRLRASGVAAIGFTPLLAWELFALIYYGFPFPNTMYAKLYTGIPQTEIWQQGVLYLMQSVSADPLTMTAIVMGLALPWLRSDRRLRAAGAVLTLYLLYVISIGGDFMTGRFLSALLFYATGILVQQPLLQAPRLAVAGLFVAVVALGLANPAQAPWLANDTYNFAAIDGKGIADERGHYYSLYGLLLANRSNRQEAGGLLPGTTEAQNYMHCGIGMRGFQASPYTHIIDFCGLTDALVARMPTIYDPNWRVGHPIRRLPDGYEGTLRTGENRIVDPDLAHYYDLLALVTQGPLFAPERWAEIWRFNIGQHDGLVDRGAQTFPDRAYIPWDHFDRSWPDHLAYVEVFGAETFRGAEFDAQGISIEFAEPQHGAWIDLGVDLDYFDVLYHNGADELGRQTVAISPLQLGEQIYTVVQPPGAVAETGYTQMTLIPRLSGKRHLTRVAVDQNREGAHVVDLARLYYFTYYRQRGDERSRQLSAFADRLSHADPAGWSMMPTAMKIDLLRLPEPFMQTLVLDNMPDQRVLSDVDDAERLRYLGYVIDRSMPQAEEPGIQLRVYFEVLAPMSQEYTFWFHIVDRMGDGEFMLYDWPPAEKTTRWPVGTIVEVPVFLALEPGEYDVSFGLWTPQSRERLYADQTNDIYWIDLGAQSVAQPQPAD